METNGQDTSTGTLPIVDVYNFIIEIMKNPELIKKYQETMKNPTYYHKSQIEIMITIKHIISSVIPKILLEMVNMAKENGDEETVEALLTHPISRLGSCSSDFYAITTAVCAYLLGAKRGKTPIVITMNTGYGRTGDYTQPRTTTVATSAQLTVSESTSILRRLAAVTLGMSNEQLITHAATIHPEHCSNHILILQSHIDIICNFYEKIYYYRVTNMKYKELMPKLVYEYMAKIDIQAICYQTPPPSDLAICVTNAQLKHKIESNLSKYEIPTQDPIQDDFSPLTGLTLIEMSAIDKARGISLPVPEPSKEPVKQWINDPYINIEPEITEEYIPNVNLGRPMAKIPDSDGCFCGAPPQKLLYEIVHEDKTSNNQTMGNHVKTKLAMMSLHNFMRGDITAALVLSEEALNLDSADPLALLVYGRSLGVLVGVKEATTMFRRCIHSCEKILSDKEMKLSNQERSLVWFCTGEATRNLIAFNVMEGTTDDVLKVLTEAIRLNNVNPAYMYSRGVTLFSAGEGALVIDDANEGLTMTATYSLNWTLRANGALLLGKWRDAVRDATEGIRLCRDNDNAYHIRAEGYRMQSKFSESIADATRSIKFQPRRPDAYSTRADCHRMLGQNSECIRDCNAAISLDPKFELAYRVRCNCYRILGRLDESIKDGDMSIKLATGTARGAAYRSRSQSHFANQDVDAAIIDINIALNISPTDIPGLRARASYYRSKSMWDMVYSDVVRVLKLDPDDIYGLNAKSDAERNMGRFNEALNSATKAVKIDPRSAMGHCMMASALFTLRRFEEADASATQAVEISRGYASAYKVRAAARKMMGRHEEARRDSETAVEIDPSLRHTDKMHSTRAA